jgi:hypothetical protein
MTMAQVLVAGAVIECSHGGRVRISSGNSLMTVGGKQVVTADMLVGLSFAPGPNMVAPCPVTTKSTPPAPSPCSSTLPPTAGLATYLSLNQLPVALDTARGNTLNTQDPGTWSVADAGQTDLEAD